MAITIDQPTNWPRGARPKRIYGWDDRYLSAIRWKIENKQSSSRLKVDPRMVKWLRQNKVENPMTFTQQKQHQQQKTHFKLNSKKS